MKYHTSIFIVLILAFTTCEKDKQIRETTCAQSDDYEYLDNSRIDSMCSSVLCTEYLTIWKELIKENNNISQEFFDTHFELCNSEIQSLADIITFRVCYIFKVDWAIAFNCDQFIIRINSNNADYPSLNLPRDTYLTKDKIKIAADNGAFSSDIIKISNVGNIKFPNMDKALNDLIAFSEVNQLCINRIRINEDNGDLVLEASAQYENEENSCIKGTIDLITGDKNMKNTPCWINYCP
jgi:hypothetical protein